MVPIMLKGGVDDGMMCIRPFTLKAPVKVDAIAIEECCIDTEEKIHVSGHNYGNQT